MRRWPTALLLPAVLLVSGATWWTWSARHEAAAAREARAAVASEHRRLVLDVAFHERRLREDPWSAADLARVAALYARRARETGDASDLRRAEAAARRALALREAHNGAAWGTLASALMARHEFPEALRAARRLVAMDSSLPSSRALLGELQLETGDYAGADSTFAPLLRWRGDPSVAPRLARWAELHGRHDDARRWLRATGEALARRDDVPRASRAWVQLRLGELALQAGDVRRARAELLAGLRLCPDDARLHGALARVAALERRWNDALAHGDSALGGAPEPATLAVLSDAAAAVGDTAAATAYARALEVAALAPGAFPHRAWSLWLLDHDRRVGEVLDAARAELRTRRDVYGWDLLAWALHKSGRDAEARPAMAAALALGTRDAVLHAHAAAIAAALGDSADAARHRAMSRRFNPLLPPVEPAR
jgi:tetratricopeptide (TPR) repeat protein